MEQQNWVKAKKKMERCGDWRRREPDQWNSRDVVVIKKRKSRSLLWGVIKWLSSYLCLWHSDTPLYVHAYMSTSYTVKACVSYLSSCLWACEDSSHNVLSVYLRIWLCCGSTSNRQEAITPSPPNISTPSKGDRYWNDGPPMSSPSIR